jgi:hypothetical protein
VGDRICSVEGCGKPHRARGLCSGCYGKASKGGQLPPRGQITPRCCTVDGCGGKHEALGLCKRHYHRLRQHGDLNLSIELPPRRTICTVDGCGLKHDTKGLCRSHHRFSQRYPGQEFRPLGTHKAGRLKRHIYVAEVAATRDRTTGCWEDWPYASKINDRPVVFIQAFGNIQYVARYVRFLEDGEWPICACHHCDNPPCWNPDHIYAGNYQSNTDDMIARGRAGWQRPSRPDVAAGSDPFDALPGEVQ